MHVYNFLSFIGMYLSTCIHVHTYTYERIFTCIYTCIYVCTYINRNGENLNQFFSLSQVDTPERSAILVYLRLSVSVSPLGAVPLCINNVIAICLQREAVSLVWGVGYLPGMWEEKSIWNLGNYRAERSGSVALLRIPSRTVLLPPRSCGGIWASLLQCCLLV